jgi:hypothetical protein
VQSILDETTTPPERADLYRKLGSDFGRRVEPLLWSLARVEPIEMARTAAYQAIDPANATDAHALLAAARREAVQRTTLVHLLVPGLVERPGEDVRRLLLELVATTADSDDEWPLMNLKLIYGRLKGDPEIERRMTACLAHPSDRIRGIAALTSADAGNRAMVPVAFELLDSKDSRARFSAVLILKRHATAEEFKQILSRDWSRDEETRLAIEAAMRSRGIEPPKQL